MSQEEELQQAAQAEPTETPAEAVQEQAELVAEPQPDAAELARQLAEATRKAEESWDRALRIQAEMDNLRRRTEKDVDAARKFALERFAKELLPVVDSLELGIQASAGDAAEVVKLREGSELTLKQLLAVLEKFNILAIDPQGQKFNPEFHQAMAMDPTAPGEANTVAKVFQKGYTLNDRLLRPAMVVVAQGGMQQAAHVDEQA